MESNTEYDQRVMSILARALGQPQGERQSYLQTACDNDANLFRDVTEALTWEERMGTFMRQPLVDFKDFERPFQVGQIISERFEILREVGEGGMGVVYEAFDRKRQQRIAIKSAKPGFQRLLSPELEGALKVRHPNICLVNEIHTAETNQGEVDFLTMEFLEGQTLSAHLATNGALDQKEAFEITRQLCAGLAEAHRNGIIHRDLKSANVILSRNGDGSLRAVITDFGLAGALTMQSGDLAGTPAYMAPELWQGGSASKASDIYALGVILYEMVTSSHPFEGKSLASRSTCGPPAPSTMVKGLKTRWDRVIARCLDSSPLTRLQDATEVIAGLEKKPFGKAPMIALALIVAVSLIPTVRQRLIEQFWPPPNVRLAVLPVEGSKDTALIGGVLQDVSDRIGRFRSERRTVAVISPSEALDSGVQKPEQAREILHATHALQTKVHKEGDEFVAEGAVIDLVTQAHVRDFYGRYSSATIGMLPGALAGEVSLALRLRVPVTSDGLSTAATAPYDRGLYLLRSDDQSFEDAIVLFEEANRLDSRSALPLAGLVEAKVLKFRATSDSRDVEDAQRFLRAAESLSPDSVRVRLAAGLLNETAGQYEKALEDYRRVQDIEPRNIDALLRIARVYAAINMPDKAVQAYQQAIELEPLYYKPYHGLGVFYYYRGEYPEAAENFQKSIDRAPGLFDEYTNLGAALSDLGRDSEAEEALLASLKLRESANALNSLGAIRAYQKRDIDAIVFYERAVRLDPHDYVYAQNLADSYRRLDRLADAKAQYRRAADLALVELGENPRQGFPRAFLAYVFARLGDAHRAEDEITQALQLAPGDNKVIRKAVLTFEALGQREKAIGVLGPATPQLLHELDRQPDLADFRQDLRFKELVSKTSKGGQ